MSSEPARFSWQSLGNMADGRPNLGTTINLAVYRLLQYSLREVLAFRFGEDMARDLLREAGRLAGSEFCRNLLDVNQPLSPFIARLQGQLRTLNMGILRMEQSDLDRMVFILTMDEDMDCSGLPISGATVCEYDEGFIGGIFSVYTGRECRAVEIDCWASGARTCRFRVSPLEEACP